MRSRTTIIDQDKNLVPETCNRNISIFIASKIWCKFNSSCKNIADNSQTTESSHAMCTVCSAAYWIPERWNMLAEVCEESKLWRGGHVWDTRPLPGR